ncbi:hypothetical protein ACTFIZ_006248 [Dictyostelium cf. discoideum]
MSQVSTHIIWILGINLISIRLYPPISEIESYEHGLLVITGRSTKEIKSEREAEGLIEIAEKEHQILSYKALVRKNLENKAINNALLRGQPTISICAGQWRLFTSIVNMDKSKEKKEEKDLLVSSKRLNKIVCFLVFLENKYVESVQYSVNSVHGYSPKLEKFQSIPTLEIGALSLSLNGSKIPEADVPEAFTYNGIVVGVLWHPEASEAKNNDYLLFQSMVKMGLQYKKKREMLNELKQLLENKNGQE